MFTQTHRVKLTLHSPTLAVQTFSLNDGKLTPMLTTVT